MRPQTAETWARVAAASCLCLVAGGCDHHEAVSPPGMLAYEVSLAGAGEQLYVGWHGGESGRERIWVRPVGPDGHPSGPALALTDGTRDAYEPDLQLLGRRLIVAWYDKDPGSGALHAWLGSFDTQGHALWQHPLSDDANQGRNPVVRVAGERIEVAWLQGRRERGTATELWSAAFAVDGQPLRIAQRAGMASGDTWNLNAAIDNSGALHVVFDAQVATRAHELQHVRIDAAGSTQNALSADDGRESRYPDLAIADGRIALTWFDELSGNRQIYAYVGTLADLQHPLDARALRITHTRGAAIGAYLAWNGPLLGIAWCDDSVGEDEIYAQLFDAAGHPRGTVRRLTYTRRQSLIPAIRPWRNGFALAWNEYQAAANASTHTHASTLASTARLEFLPAPTTTY